MAIQVQEFPPHDLGRNSDGYRMMTNKRVYMTSSSEYSFIRDLGRLSESNMRICDEPNSRNDACADRSKRA